MFDIRWIFGISVNVLQYRNNVLLKISQLMKVVLVVQHFKYDYMRNHGIWSSWVYQY